ncbi:MAG: Gfo/Idh/MocA family protein [Actinomycetes bacterium]
MTAGFAILGCGVIGRHHASMLAALQDEARAAVVVDRGAETAEKVAAEHGCAATTSYAEALARPDVDVVTVCLPSGLHADAAVAALEAGKDVLVEKPVDITLEAADRLAAAQRATGRTVGVVSQHRFDESAQVLHRAVTAGRLGRLTSGSAQISWWRSRAYYDSGAWRGSWALDGGGALMNQGIHTIDLLCWMLGEPAEVVAYTGRLAHEGIEVEDTGAATVRFANGALGSVLGTTAAYPGLTTRLQVHGDRGSAVIDDDRLAYFHAAPEGEAYGLAGAWGDLGNQAASVLPDQTGGPTAGGDPAALSDAHLRQIRDFLDARRDGRPPLVGVAEARVPLALVLGIYESARTGRPVRLEG